MQKILLIGGGGHAKVLIDLMKLSGKYKIAGILDTQLTVGTVVLGIPVLGNDDLLPELFKQGISNACLSVGNVNNNGKREKIYEIVKEIGFQVPFLIHPTAVISENNKILQGAQIMAGTIIQIGSFIGENAIINTGAIVEHDCSIGRHVHICPGAVISGGCTIGKGSFIGAGATVVQGKNIGENSIIAAGAVVINDVPDNGKVMGVPAKEVKE